MLCAIGDGMFREKLQHCCEAEEKLILSLESIPAWGEDANIWKGWGLGMQAHACCSLNSGDKASWGPCPYKHSESLPVPST